MIVKNTEMVRTFGAKWSAGTSECDGVVLSVMDMASTCVLCPRLKNLMSVSFGLVEDFGVRWSKSGERWSKVEESGAKWESLEQCGGV